MADVVLWHLGTSRRHRLHAPCRGVEPQTPHWRAARACALLFCPQFSLPTAFSPERLLSDLTRDGAGMAMRCPMDGCWFPSAARIRGGCRDEAGGVERGAQATVLRRSSPRSPRWGRLTAHPPQGCGVVSGGNNSPRVQCSRRQSCSRMSRPTFCSPISIRWREDFEIPNWRAKSR
jgi:hypothetical protein